MANDFRNSGLKDIPLVPWGTHCCLFYHTIEELVDIAAPFIQSGLADNECCMWFTPRNLSPETAKTRLTERGLDLESHIRKGQLVIADTQAHYLKFGPFDADAVINSWLDTADQSISRGFDGLRLIGDGFWAGECGRDPYIAYEARIDAGLEGLPILALCTYGRNQCDFADIVSGATNHEYAVIKENGQWQVLKNLGRRRAEQYLEEIAEREAQLESLLQAAPVGVGFVEIKIKNDLVTERRFRNVNDRLCEITGYTREELCGQSTELVYPNASDHDFVAKELFAQIKNYPAGTVETRWRKKTGEIIDILLSSAPIDPSDWSAGISFTAMDITYRKKIEREQRRLEHQLRHSQKMEAVGQLAGGIAHDFNNLLQIINGYADLMSDDLDRHHPARPGLNEIMTAGNRAAKLVRQLLAFSRRQIMRMEDVELNDLISNLLNMLQRLIGEHIEIDFIPGRHIGMVRADAGQIEQVLVNLCVNARDAMPEGGKLTIETENILINGEYCRTHNWAEPGRFVLISVTDTGCGVDEKTAKRIFEPFFSTKPVDQGSGLGLATAYGIIRQHDGIINVYSEPGKGTLFKIYLPVVQRRAVEVGADIQGRVIGGNETILIAEDDDMVRDLMLTVLERAGYTALSAEDGEEAVAVFRANIDRVDLAVLDVIMPRKSGREVHDIIKRFNPSVKVLFSSGYSTNAIHTNFVLENGMELLRKPFTAEDLLRKIRDLLDAGETPTAS